VQRVAPVVRQDLAPVEPTDVVAIYVVMERPPRSAGGVQETLIDAFPAITSTPNGAVGSAPGSTAAEFAESAPSPALFTNRTVKV
jgi:hypothetical protein